MLRSIGDPTNTQHLEQHLDAAAETPPPANAAVQPAAGLAAQAAAVQPDAVPLDGRSATASPSVPSRAEVAAQVIVTFANRLDVSRLPPPADTLASTYLEALNAALMETHGESPDPHKLYLHSIVLPVLANALDLVMEDVDDAAALVLLDDLACAGRRLAAALPACVDYLRATTSMPRDSHDAEEAERALFGEPLSAIEAIAQGSPGAALAIMPMCTSSSKSTPAA